MLNVHADCIRARWSSMISLLNAVVGQNDGQVDAMVIRRNCSLILFHS